MARSARSTVILGAATALALATAGWLTAGTAFADDTPTPTDTAVPSDTPTTDPTDDPTTPPDDSTDGDGTSDDAPSDPAPDYTPPPKQPGGTLTLPKIPKQQDEPAVTTGANSFSNPTRIEGSYFFLEYDNSTATVQSGEPRKIQGGNYIHRTQWIKWKATRTGNVYISAVSVSGNSDTAINVYSGSSLSTLKLKASDDDQYFPLDNSAGSAGAPPYSAAILGVDVTKGHSYYIQLGTSYFSKTSVPVASTDIQVSILGVDYNPSNDHLNHAKEIKLGSDATGSADGTFAGAQIDPWEPSDNYLSSAKTRIGSIWFKWTAPADGHANFGDCALGDYHGPSLALFSNYYGAPGNGYGDLDQYGFGWDNGCNFLGILGGADIDNVSVNKGQTYYMQVSETLGGLDQEISMNISATFDTPWIGKLNHTSGALAGGNTVKIQGQALNSGGAPTVKFGSKSAHVNSYSATEISVRVPAGVNLGKVDVVVKSGSDTSNKKSYTYTP
jgi:hypothetical protein